MREYEAFVKLEGIESKVSVGIYNSEFEAERAIAIQRSKNKLFKWGWIENLDSGYFYDVDKQGD